MAGGLQNLAGRCCAGLDSHKIDAHAVAVEHRARRRSRVWGSGARGGHAGGVRAGQIGGAMLIVREAIGPQVHVAAWLRGLEVHCRGSLGLVFDNNRCGAGGGAAAVGCLANRHKAEPVSSQRLR